MTAVATASTSEVSSPLIMSTEATSSVFTASLLTGSSPACSSPSKLAVHSADKRGMHHMVNEEWLYERIIAKNDKLSLSVIKFMEQMIDQYTLDGLALSFNGGKDCVVLLHLLRISIWLHYTSSISIAIKEDPSSISDTSSAMKGKREIIREDTTDMDRTKKGMKSSMSIPIIWFQKAHEFPELIDFCFNELDKYGMIVFKECSDFKIGLENFVKEKPNVKGVFMGQRRTDPYCGDLTTEAHCSEGWPDIVRINPLLDWTYSMIWSFIDEYGIDYCLLYDQGYTSLGDSHFTIPNPLLLNPRLQSTDTVSSQWKPARELGKLKFADQCERLGRIYKPKRVKSPSNADICDQMEHFLLSVRELKLKSFHECLADSDLSEPDQTSVSSSLSSGEDAMISQSFAVNVCINDRIDNWSEELQNQIRNGIRTALFDSSLSINFYFESDPVKHNSQIRQYRTHSLTMEIS